MAQPSLSSDVLNIYLRAVWNLKRNNLRTTSGVQGSNNGATPARVIMRKLVINASAKFATGVLSKEQKPLVIGKQVEIERDGKKGSQVQPDLFTNSTAQGGATWSFKNRKPIGEIGCCESGMAERIHWWTERCLRSPLFLSLSLTIYLPTYLSSMYLSIYRSISLSLSLSS